MFSTLRMGMGACLAAALALGLPTHAPAERGKPYVTVAKFDTDGDGLVSPEEWPKNMKSFNKVDKDQDGFLSPLDFATHWGMELPPPPGAEPKTPPQKTQAAPPPLPEELYFVDAHSQLPSAAESDKIVPLLDKVGIHNVILSFRGTAKGNDVIDLAARHPERITPAVSIKSPTWSKGNEKFFKTVKKQLKTGVFRAMGEAIFYHAAKGGKKKKAPEWVVQPDSKQAQFALNIARKKGWPYIVHWESKSSPDKEKWKASFDKLFSGNRDMHFPIIHMGQLDVEEAADWIRRHPNISFMLSKANPIKVKSSNQPWTNMFDGKELKPKWRDLMVANSDRFIFALDSTWPKDWGSHYTSQAKLWRGALERLPKEVAHAIAHGNAERLWKIKPKYAMTAGPTAAPKQATRKGGRIPMIDAHSQVDCKVSEDLVLKQIEKLDISRVLISVRGCKGWKSGDLEARSLKWAANSPDRISHLLTTKVDGWSFNKLSDNGITAFKRRAKRKGFIGMGEVLVQHAAHDTPNLKYPELDISLNDKRIRAAMAVARDKSWPVILHLELNDNEDKSEQTLKDLEEMLATYPDTPFVLIHMAQASVGEARTLLEKHKNLYFMTTHADDLSAALLKKKKSKKIVAQMGWINLFQGGCKIKHCPTGWNLDWKQLIVDYPSRFVLAFENVFPSHWKKPFEQKVGIWRRALKMLPEDVAHAVAHENAERLWRLPPAR